MPSANSLPGPDDQGMSTATPPPPATGRRIWTPEQVRRLGMTTDLETAADVIGIGRTLAYELARTGDFPIRLLRLGRRVVVPIADLLTFLGHSE